MNTPINKLSYQFSFDDQDSIEFEILLNDKDLSNVTPPPEALPEWTMLTYNQCNNCPLTPADNQRCPVSINLVNVFDSFRDIVSHKKSTMFITTEDRVYQHTSDVQRGLSSLLGVVMATSGCPILDKLRPMVRTHLPFSSLKETLYRVVSMYVLAQHFRERKNLSSSTSLEGLTKIYQDITEVNHGLSSRMRSFFGSDANINAIVLLNCMAEYTAITLEDDLLEELEDLFYAYF